MALKVDAAPLRKSVSHEQVTNGLVEIGACWANSDKKYQGTGFNDTTPTWHVHPDSSYPHVDSILQFDTLVQIMGYVDTIKLIRENNLSDEDAYDTMQDFWYSIEG